jgi:ketosteroid isomerase-like protein
MRRSQVVVVLLAALMSWPALADGTPPQAGSSSPATGRISISSDRMVVEQTIRDSIGWAMTKDRALLERIIAHDADLFMFNPDSKSTIVGWNAFTKNFAFWMDPRFKATRFDLRELRTNFSRSGDVAWFSAILDDLAEWDGKPTGWKDTRWTGVLEKREGAWVIVQMHFSFASDRVPTEPTAAAGRSLFFASSREGRDDVFWIDARVVASLRPSAKPPKK